MKLKALQAAFIGLFLTGSLVVSASELRVGAAAVNITPPVGIGMAGYYFERGAQGTNDDLFSKAIVIEHNGARAALVGLDLISTTRAMIEAVRREIEQTTPLRGDHVMISATHAHTGPVLARRGTRESSQGGDTDLSQRYSTELPKRIAESVRLAMSRLQPARASVAVGRAEHLSFNRRFFMTDGTVGWNPGKLNPKIAKPAGPIDPEVGVVLFEAPREKLAAEPLATYVNFAMHPDTVGGEYFSADYPGALSRILAGYKGAGMMTLFANGTCGNINHIDVHWAGPQKGPQEAHRIGTVLAAAVFQAYKQLQQPLKAGSLRARSEIVKLPLPEIKPEDIEKARATVKRYSMKDNSGFMEKVQAYKVLDVAAREGKPQEVEVQVIALGDDLAWVSLPGEIFVELGLAIKKASPFRYTMIAELANGSIGYIPNQEAYPQGNYEVVSARCAAGSGEMLVEAALRLMRELKR
ncbi:MAG: neutral/alkaline non-lysosomal ceramidase N-terminal domain-containing protein [Verrucomicrobia bacterium]|nr:neutral/alkaline non-lysosomal ceramidase N-terminal domain-containing protein [Verrucomicrobiota bacterium]